jgi:hypothetical protein
MDEDAIDHEASRRSRGLTPNAYVLEGLAGAAARLDHSRLIKDECGMFAATYEALMWVMVLDDRLRRSGGPTFATATSIRMVASCRGCVSLGMH